MTPHVKVGLLKTWTHRLRSARSARCLDRAMPMDPKPEPMQALYP